MSRVVPSRQYIPHLLERRASRRRMPATAERRHRCQMTGDPEAYNDRAPKGAPQGSRSEKELGQKARYQDRAVPGVTMTIGLGSSSLFTRDKVYSKVSRGISNVSSTASQVAKC